MATTSRTVALGALALAATLGLSGCSAGVNGAAGGAPDVAVQPVPAPGLPSQPDKGYESAADGGVALQSSTTERSVIVTGWATILVEDPAAAADSAVDIVTAAGGRVDARSIQAPTEYSAGSASLTLRVPADELDGVIEQLGGLGTVQTVSTNASDVTVAVQDLEARISALRSSIQRLEDLQAQASDIDALIQLETTIADRQGQLESLEAQQRYYDDQIAMSTMTVDLVTKPVVAEPDPDSFWDGIVKGWNALAAFGAGLLVVIGVLLPWLIPLAVIGAIVWIWVAAARSRRRKRAAAAAPPAEAPPTP
ncbi:MAG: DUF4349 domain-containing protein [Microbacteriaceae bacterium]|nr:DUF4349 domain-containing protein [Microbacteriaceae bacterium]